MKSIYERAMEEIDRQRAAKAKKRTGPRRSKKRGKRRKKPNLRTEIDPESIQKAIEEAKRIDLNVPPSVPPNARHSCPAHIVLDGASNRHWSNTRRNIQLD